MIILLHGEDTYRMREKLNQIVKKYEKTHKSGLNLKYFDAQEIEFQEFLDRIKITSMFDEKKLIVLRNVFSNNNLKEDFLEEAERLNKMDNIVVLYQRKKMDKRDKLFRFLKKKAKHQEFRLLQGEKLRDWIKKEFEKYETKIEERAITALIDYVGNDIWRLANEIKKLVSYKKRSAVEEKDVKVLVKPKIETNIFKTIDAIAAKNKKRALQLIDEHLEKGDSPLYILSMINYQFRNLLIVKGLVEEYKPYKVILKKTGLHPFVVKKTYSQSKKFTLNELKKIYQKIFKVDLDIKTGKIDPRLGLEILISKI